jgi:hypothetical protein
MFFVFVSLIVRSFRVNSGAKIVISGLMRGAGKTGSWEVAGGMLAELKTPHPNFLHL